MLTRLVAGLVGLAVVIPVLVYGGENAVWWLSLPFLVIALDEYARMALPELPLGEKILFWVLGVAVAATAVFAGPQVLVATGLATMVLTVVPMFRRPEVDVAARQAVRLGFGLVYVPLLLAPLSLIRHEKDGLALIFFVLASTWLGDTGAYFAGRFFGKTPLFPRVSPKKTREGLLGGLFLSVVGACVVKVVGNPDLSWPAVIVVSALLDLAGVVGDLVESMLKRAFGVKDSGSIMPGHGGILDRIDSLLFSGSLLWALLQVRPLLAG